MATSSSSSLYPQQQQPQLQQPQVGDQPQPAATVNPVAAVPAHHSSSSIGPFFAVMSVLVVLAVLSCFLGRICAQRKAMMTVAADSPLEMIKGGGLRGWLRRKWRRCLARDVEAGAKVADCAETAKDSDVPPA